jgi:5'-nucleotidase / UDP-sugar diphosphatase
MRVRCFVLAILIPCLAVPVSDASQRLTILHSNDVHGHLRPFSYPGIESPGTGSILAGSMMSDGAIAAFDLPARRDIGGIARRATIAARIRAELAKQGTPVWLIDAGDFYYYSAWSNETHGVADVIAMNRAGYDYATFGNHEFEDSLAQLKRLIATARFDFLCANVADSATGRPLTQRCVIRQVGAVRVGVFGLVTGSVARKPAAREGLAIEDPVRAAAALVARLRGPDQADIVVLISHCGDPMDRRLAREVRGIDVIVGSHWHTRLPQGELVRWSDELKPDEVDGTIIVQAGQWGGELGRLDLLLERNAAGQWRVVRYQERLIPVTGETPDDPAVAAVLDSLWAPYAARYDEVLATATADFADRGDDLARNNLVADAVRAALGVEVEFESPGGMHLPILAGPVTRAMLADLDQRSATIVTFRMRGSEIRRFVQRSRPVASGLRYRMFCGRFEDLTVGGAPLDDARVYSCAGSSALAGRLDGFETLEWRDTKRLRADVVIAAIRKRVTIAPAFDGRRVVVDTLQVRPHSE